MPSRHTQEGYLFIDHRASPGTISVPEGKLFEGATITCSHCQRMVVLNHDRTRERGYCPHCDHYICDQCNADRIAPGYIHKSFAQLVDEILEQGHNIGIQV